MSNITYLGRKAGSFNSSPQFDGYTRVVITVSEDVEYSAGVETGRTMSLECPWGTQAMANNILANIRGFQYQPYTATDALLDPAAELGDGITVNNVYGAIYTRETKFGPLCRSTVSAPSEEELDHECPYVPKQERKVIRQLCNLSAELIVQAGLISAEVSERKSDVESLQSALKVQAGLISAEVSERKSETESLKSSLTLQASQISAEIQTRQSETSSLRSTLNLQANQISAKVSKTGGSSSSFGWDLTDSSWVVKASGSTVFQITKNGADVTGKITATGGKIGGFDILSDHLSYNGQTWGGTNTHGAYLGTSGLQMGKNFQVDMAGNLYAASGTFSGYVKAGKIQYGGSDGTLDGYALTGGTVTGGYGGAICGGSLSTYNMTGGINTSLGRADWAYNALNGWTNIPLVKATAMQVSGKMLVFTNITFVNSSGGTTTMPVVTWRVA